MSYLLVFTFPYVIALYGAAYNANQALQGMIKHAPNPAAIPAGAGPMVSVFEPALDTNVIWLSLIAYCVLILLPALLLSGYVIKRWKGCVLALAVVLVPGVLAVVGVFPAIDFLPREFVIDALGVLGDAGGMFPLVLLVLISGWSAVLILSDVLQLGDNFRHLYDHAWYATAVVTGIFFVADLGAAHTARELQTENDLSRQASGYLLRQVRDYDLHCQSMKWSKKPSCTWASQVQETLNDYATWNERLYYTVGPNNTAAIYNPFRYERDEGKISAIRRELKEFNEAQCPRRSLGNGWYQSAISGTCQRPPGAFLKVYPEPLDGKVDHDAPTRTVAVANEVIVPSLVASRERQERLKSEAERYTRYLNLKWIFYIVFSFAAGGKVANSTARMIEIGKQPPTEQRRSLQAVRLTWRGIGGAIKLTAKLAQRSWNGLGRLLAKVPGLKRKTSVDDKTT